METAHIDKPWSTHVDPPTCPLSGPGLHRAAFPKADGCLSSCSHYQDFKGGSQTRSTYGYVESLPQKLSENGRIQESAFLYCVAVQNSTHSYTQSSDLMKEDGEGARVYFKKKCKFASQRIQT